MYANSLASLPILSRLEAIVAGLFLVVLFAGCDTANQQKTFIEEAEAEPSGFTATDANGGVTSEDSDDWRTSPVYVGRIVVDPAYPNPFTAGVVTIPFRVLQFNEVTGGMYVRAFDGQGRLFAIGEALDTSSPGLYTITINPAQLSTKGLHRLFLQDVFGEVVSYGDLMIN